MDKVDLNCDMGESFGNYTCGMDADIAEYISRMVDTSTHDERFYPVRKRDIFGVWHLLTVEGGVPTNAVPYTETDGIR